MLLDFNCEIFDLNHKWNYKNNAYVQKKHHQSKLIPSSIV